ncbi:nadh dehydrogenase [Zalerion maritima]|uniref:NADH dehydrogenase [ubiquinone] 1 alpha subcomplex subunit 13 n=1 Tax=Zalerion maritima TaxID=339359 RepID=A0AAD5WUG0_9PEZI|nr:nadh dehydrogenase [Zalerion maritima]
MPQDMPPVGGYGPVQYKEIEEMPKARKEEASRSPPRNTDDEVYIKERILRHFETRGRTVGGILRGAMERAPPCTVVLKLALGGHQHRPCNMENRKQWKEQNQQSGDPDHFQDIPRNLPARGFRPGMLLFGSGLIMVYGWYYAIRGIREKNELLREKMWSRIHLVPLLQAEEDRDQVRRYLADQERERLLLGENKRIYNSDRFVRPTFAATPSVTKG